MANFLTRRFKDEFLNAWSDYHLLDEDEGEEPPEPDEEHETVFMPYALLHWDPDSPESTANLVDGGMIARAFVEQRSRYLPEMERQILGVLIRQPFSFYEVVSCPPDQDFLLRDLFTGQEITVSKLSADEEMELGEIIYAQLLPMPGVTVIAFAAPILISAHLKPAIEGFRDGLRPQSDGGLRELTLDDLRAQQDELRVAYFEILNLGPGVDDDENDERAS